MIEHHNLPDELPEFRDCIHGLGLRNPQFAGPCRQCQDVDKQVYRIEEEIETPSDHYTEDLKKKRVLLKDQLHDLLRNA